MELKIYLRTLLKKWWIILFAFLVTLGATTALTFTQTPTYTSTATFIVTPSDSLDEIGSFASRLDIVSRRTEIANTYAQVAVSRWIGQEVADELGLSLDQRKDYIVESRLRAGTNVLEITVEGSDRVVVSDFANLVGIKMIAYVRNLYEAFDLVSLDGAPVPLDPIKPNKVLNLATGTIFGLVLGVGLAFLSAYLQAPLETVATADVFDVETGAYNKRYFVQRLGEEMSRARRNKYPLSLAMMNVDQLEVLRTASSEIRREILRKVVVSLQQYLREEDLVARLEGTVFGFLLPDIAEEEAKARMEKLQTRMAWTPYEIEKSGVKLNLSASVGVAAYQYNGTRQDEFMAQADRALQHAEATGYGRVSSFLESLSEEEDTGRTTT
jgi:diguanylate cyclase (GGDEF)-like protein